MAVNVIDKLFNCEKCGCVAVGIMIDDYDCEVGFGKAVGFCPNCGEKVERKKEVDE